ncbi:nodulation-signaling pathway 2 protein [Selaginella moellendorffii]|uniref:nodulation-signaling pathway 2 protein n=1 Tax=Selaginella moellendorffii TaxID=88036 RepID=UPI000D1CF627|nr:nodulation-signaling pathway 2 protein [Selaginella moellendorffii]|eukprot:XP_024522497.1 nodulation-signaling pathway 2 protein [Selaginella moellendorffii]
MDTSIADIPVLVERWSFESHSPSSFDDSRNSEDTVSPDYSGEFVQSSAACEDDDLRRLMKAMLDDHERSFPDPQQVAVNPVSPPQYQQQQEIERSLVDFRHHSHDERVDFVYPELGVQVHPWDEGMDSIRLVHLLLGAAEAIVCGEADLAIAIIDRLKSCCSTQSRTTMQRIAAYFRDALNCRLHGLKFFSRTESLFDTVGAFHVLHEICPYIKFGHFSANQAILESVAGEQRVHIVDFDITDGVQWPSLMQSLALRAGGPPQLKITALYRPNAKGALSTTQETGKRLAACARQFNVPFVFNQVRVDGESEEFRSSSLKLIQGEALVVNCMLHLPHMSCHSRDAVRFFLGKMAAIRPRVLAIVEEDLSCTSTTFTGRFHEALYHYSTLFDSLEATLASEDEMRSLVERVFLGPRIKNTVTSAVSQSPLEKEAVSHVDFSGKMVKNRWSGLAEAVGFQQRSFSSYNRCQARLLVGLFQDGHQIQEDEDTMLLCWKSRPLIAASVWSSSSDPA